jgi:cysteinyl-tRNA synthetase
MVLKLYNTLSRGIEDFRPVKNQPVLYYSCGPTVHDYAHIGNFRTFVVQDILKRWLQEKGFRVKHIMNITDVDEKTVERSKRKKIPLSRLTKKFEKAFFEDLDCLNILRADHYPRVSDNVGAISDYVQELHTMGFVFKDEEGSYYFDINSYKDYGKLSGNRPSRKIKALEAREDYNRPKNFLLWKKCDTTEGDWCWNTVLGKGFPGWHIECAALAQKYLGKTIDIHSGGVDLIFPHHENEIAEAESKTGRTFSRYWVHVEHLIVYGKKMSKSLGNFFTLRQIIKKGFDPRAIRILYIKTHYRTRLDFDFDKLREAESEVRLLEGLMDEIENVESSGDDDQSQEIRAFRKGFTDFLDNDLKTGLGYNLFISFVSSAREKLLSGRISREGAKSIKETVLWVDGVLGVLGECKLTR